MPIEVLADRIASDRNTGAPAKAGAPSTQRPLLELELRPHQSLSPEGFVTFMAATFGMVAIPIVGLLGTMALWGVLPFVALVLGGLWLGLKRSWRDRRIVETFALTADEALLVRRDPDGTLRDWRANPYWVRVERHERVGSISDYLTLEGGPRAVEIGAFLTPQERRGLERRLVGALRAAVEGA